LAQPLPECERGAVSRPRRLHGGTERNVRQGPLHPLLPADARAGPGRFRMFERGPAVIGFELVAVAEHHPATVYATSP
jgi:hypothetical protein